MNCTFLYQNLSFVYNNKNRQKEAVMRQEPLQDSREPAFSTFPIADESEILPDSKVSIPAEDNVSQAREWVNENKK